jgi:D-glycero-alpha-D-manno-heptose 1-phosphate guanylyltransferase
MTHPDVVILAGGRGTRLQSTVPDLPKPMAPVSGKPFLEYLLNFLKDQGVTRVILSVGFMCDKIISHFGYEYRGMKMNYAIEEKPLGTGGGIKLALEQCRTRDVMIFNGDTFFAESTMNLVKFHHEQKGLISLYLKPMNQPGRYGTVEIKDARVVDFKEKNDTLDFGLINAGVYCVTKNLLDAREVKTEFSFETDILKPFVKNNDVFGLVGDSYFIDIGIPEDYKRANETFRNLGY